MPTRIAPMLAVGDADAAQDPRLTGRAPGDQMSRSVRPGVWARIRRAGR